MLLGTEGPVMTLNDENFSFLSLSTYIHTAQEHKHIYILYTYASYAHSAVCGQLTWNCLAAGHEQQQKEIRKTVKNSTEKAEYKTVHVLHMVDSTAFIVSLSCQTATLKTRLQKCFNLCKKA